MVGSLTSATSIYQTEAMASSLFVFASNRAKDGFRGWLEAEREDQLAQCHRLTAGPFGITAVATRAGFGLLLDAEHGIV